MKNKETYKQLLTLQENCIAGINKIIDIHENDSDLSHTVGLDPYCQYCEQYNDLENKFQTIKKNIQLYEVEHKISSTKTTPKKPIKKKRTNSPYVVYDIIFKDGDQYLIYSNSLDNAASIAKRNSDDISHSTVIKKEYYHSQYLENKNGDVTNLSILVTDLKKKSVVLAKKEQNTNRIKGLCYNEIPFEFFRYSINQIEKLKKFCGENTTITKSKKNSGIKKGKINIQGSRGSFSLENGQILVKLGKGFFITMTPEEFEEYFSEAESLRWNRIDY